MKTKSKYNLTAEAMAELPLAQVQRLKREEADDYREHGVVVADTGKTDIVRDIRWVYERMAQLCMVTPLGNRVLDVDVLRHAPSNGAVSMATFYRDDSKGFMKTYAPKLIPKDVGKEDEKSSIEELRKDLDPEFDLMEKYLRNVK